LALPKAAGRPSNSGQSREELKPKAEALADVGVSTSEAHRAEKLAKKSKESQENHIEKAVEAVEKPKAARTRQGTNKYRPELTESLQMPYRALTGIESPLAGRANHFAQLGIFAHNVLLSFCASAILAGVMRLRIRALLTDARSKP
jgi:hypothetical protein